jgi:four helix bundle protein
LKQRTKQYALRIIKLVNSLPNNTTGWVIGKQLIRSGTGVAANYRAACRSRSIAEFIAKIGIVIEETDESAFWLELIMETNLLKKELIEPIYQETTEILAIMITSSNTASKKKIINH